MGLNGWLFKVVFSFLRGRFLRASACLCLVLLPDVLPAPLFGASHVHHDEILGKVLLPVQLRHAGVLVSESQGLRNHAPDASCLQRYGKRPPLTPLFQESVFHDVQNREAVSRPGFPCRGTPE